jgi:HSP20 family protein
MPAWDHLSDLLVLHERGVVPRGPASGSSWVPPVDLHETTTHYVLSAEVPGLASGDVQVRVTPNSVTISGQRRPLPVEPRQFLRIERGQGDFARTFTFADAIDPAGIVADLRHGVLTVRIPRIGAAAVKVEIA